MTGESPTFKEPVLPGVISQDPTSKAASPMGIHATPGAVSRGDADTDSIGGCRAESGETGARTHGGSQATNDGNTPEGLNDSSFSGPKLPSTSNPSEKEEAA